VYSYQTRSATHGYVTRAEITGGLAEFCEQHYSRMPHQYWQDPSQRAREYVCLHQPPWV
jgi:hypothetical protein